MKAVNCAQCDADKGLFRPIQLAKSMALLWACSEDCEDALRVHLSMQYDDCPSCKGEGEHVSPERHVTCSTCKGKGMVPR